MTSGWRRHAPDIADVDVSEGFWVFAYGSLMWNPGFDPVEQELGRLPEYHRAFCMTSIVYRGTPEYPGLVLALDKRTDAECHGVAYRISASDAEGVLDYLRERELVSSAYCEAIEPVELADGRRVSALCYVMNKTHDQYCGTLSLQTQAEIISRAAGPAGTNRDYLMNTVQSMRQMGLMDEALFSLAEHVRKLP